MEIRSKWKGPAAAAALFMLFLIWHFFDVRAGIRQTGDQWMAGLYGGLGVWLAAVLSAAFFLLLKKKIRLELCGALLTVLLGAAAMVSLPPLSAPDEIAHFASAYALSSRLLGMEAEDENGNIYLRREDLVLSDLYGASGDEERISLGRTLEAETWQVLADHAFPVFTGEEGRQMVPSVIGTIRTTPAAFAAPALGIAFARLLGLNCVFLAFLGRFMNLLLLAASVYGSMRLLPSGKSLIAGTALLPMALHLGGSFSYDTFLLAGCFFYGSYCFYLAFVCPQVRKRDVAVLGILIALFGPCKMVYAVMMGFALLIPIKKFGSLRFWALSAAAVFGMFALSMAAVNSQTIAVYAEGSDNYVSWAGEAGYTIPYLLHNPAAYLRMVYETLVHQTDEWFLTMMGNAMGNLDPVLSVPSFLIFAMAACLAALSLKKADEPLYLKTGQKIWILFLAGAGLLGLMTAMLVGWTPLSSGVIEGVQGRYLLPFLPFVLMTAKSGRIVRTAGDDRRILFYLCAMDACAFLRLFSIVSMRV